MAASPGKPPGVFHAGAGADHAAGSARAWPTLESLLVDALSALETRDTLALERMSFGREEFLKIYHRIETDTSRSRREFVTSYFLSDNRKLLNRHLERRGGHPATLLRFAVEGPVEDHDGLVLHRGLRIWIKIRDGEEELRFFKSAAKSEAGWKIWSFSDG